MARPQKRKRSDEGGSSDEDISMGKQVLPVANLPLDFDGEPMDGLQYLFTVRRDARTLPNTTRATNPYAINEEPAKSQSKAVVPDTPHPDLPSQKWRDTFVRRFRNFRMNIVQPTIHVEMPTDSRKKLHPAMHDRDCWWAFIAGRPEIEWNPPVEPKPPKRLNAYQRNLRYGGGMRADYSGGTISTRGSAEPEGPTQETWYINEEGEVELAVTIDPAESLPTPSGTPAPQEQPIDSYHEGTIHRAAPSPVLHEDTSSAAVQYTPREPTPTLLRRIDHRYALHMIMYFVCWINRHLHEHTSPLTATHARWIFAILARVEEHITGDDIALLRSLARACMACIKELACSPPADDAEYMPASSCWLVVTAVAGVWGQRDLWMDAEAMLAGKDV